MDDLLRIQNFKEYLGRNINYHPSKGASLSNTPFCSYHQTHDHYANDCSDFQKIMQESVDNGTIKIIDENPSYSNNTCPTSQEKRSNLIDDQDKLSSRIFCRLKYDNNVVFPFIRLN